MPYFVRPKVKDGVKVSRGRDGLCLVFNGEEYSITPAPPHTLDTIHRFIQSLDGTRDIDGVGADLPEIDAATVTMFLEVLDECGLLTDASQATGITGIQLMCGIEELAYHRQQAQGETELTRLLLDGKAAPEVVVGWTVEYWHVTHRAHDCISPAISVQTKWQDLLIEYFRDEYHHDRLLEKSLNSVGISSDELNDSQPLPYTAALSNYLIDLAHHDPLSFAASLFLFEGTETAGQQYIDALRCYGFPDKFVAFQEKHHLINVQGDHGNISRELIRRLNAVDLSTEHFVRENIETLLGFFWRQHETVLAHYSAHNGKIRRSKAESEDLWSGDWLGNIIDYSASRERSLGTLLTDSVRRYLLSQFLRFGASALAKDAVTTVKDEFSELYLKVSRIATSGVNPPCLAATALARQLAVLSETSPEAYLVALTAVVHYWLGESSVFAELNNQVDHALNPHGWGDSKRKRIARELDLALETCDLICGELSVEPDGTIKSEQPELRQHIDRWPTT